MRPLAKLRLAVPIIETVEGLENVEVIAAVWAARIHAGYGGNGDGARLAAAVRRGALFLTTQTDIGCMATAAGSCTRGIIAALEGEPNAA